ncbi:SMC family ATPase [Candidatus Cyanaurora vandensis]|uniref:AAA family ATPase n=1 Tax=Candidatus Cyanaurora vandensis TaxID=2714958 RepID=UPI0025808974|nr:SMC family ATPase [Candidatus Cyanaurora vandensis]
MIPLQLTLTNFLSYGHGQVDFTSLHTACICGDNGAGKSALLEAMGWALWGKSRATNEEDLIRSGTTEAQVDFTFRCEGTVYRVLRIRVKGKAGTLEFQVSPDGGQQFRVVTSRTNRQTQDLIIQALKMDYETFINSAYLRQGHADEFTIKKPTERKEVLTEILGLNRYDQLAEKAKEKAREFKTQIDLLKEQLQKIDTLLLTRPQIEEQQTQLAAQLQQLSTQQTQLETQIQLLQQQVQLAEAQKQQCQLLHQQIETITRTQLRIQDEQHRQQQLILHLTQILDQQATIEANYQQYQQLLAQAAQLDQHQDQYQQLSETRQQLEREIDQERNRLSVHLQAFLTKLEGLQEQQRKYREQLNEQPTVNKGLEALRQARANLKAYEERQAIAQPQMQQRQQLTQQLMSERLELEARYKDVRYQTTSLGSELSKRVLLEKQLEQLSQQNEKLQRQAVYKERVKEKGYERKAEKQRLERLLTDCEERLSGLSDKDRLMHQSLTNCPLCNQELDDNHRQQIQTQHQQEAQQLEDERTLLQHQISYAEQEIKLLRSTWAELNLELDGLDSQLQKQGRLHQQLEAYREKEAAFKELKIQERTLKHQLEEESFGPEIRQQLQLIDLELKRLDFNENDYPLHHAEVDRHRWAESRHQLLQEAQHELNRLDQEIPTLQQRCSNGKQLIDEQQFCPLQQTQLQAVQQQLHQLQYDHPHHQQVKQQVQQQRPLLHRYEELQRALAQIRPEQERLTQIQHEAQALTTEVHQLTQQLTHLQHQLAQTPDPAPALVDHQTQLKLNRIHQDQHRANLGATCQQLAFLDNLQTQRVQDQQQLDHSHYQHTLYKELVTAFGKNGIQALIIESVLPELEAEANQLLARLSDNQLHVRFQTQKTTKTTAKLIETLDILIGDNRGTRPYETYSGGEAFRVNFAIRLALSRLLARRAGAALQTLIIDEGFGSQDREGRERLIEAINLVAADFACILVITHITDLKEVFPARIEVEKGDRGSHLSVVV